MITFSIAVVLLHSYANPAHERCVAAILAEAMPDALVSISSEVLPVIREYPRLIRSHPTPPSIARSFQ